MGEKPGRKEYKERNELVKKLASDGLHYEAIGKQIGLTRQRIHQIVKGIGRYYQKPVDKSGVDSLTRV